MSNTKGFSIVELLILLAFILIIVAVAVPKIQEEMGIRPQGTVRLIK